MDVSQESAEIKLGGEVFRVSALTWDQLQRVAPQLDMLTAGAGLAQKLPALRAIIAEATGSKSEDLGKLTANVAELFDAIDAITRITGIEQLEQKVAEKNRKRLAALTTAAPGAQA